jgi:hypothetical protein
MTWDPQETARQARLVADWEANMDVREEMACGTLWRVRFGLTTRMAGAVTIGAERSQRVEPG